MALTDAIRQYLVRYGYLAPAAGLHESTDRDVEALRRYQRFFQLEETGEVDEATARLMATPRCGIPDVFPEGFVAQGSKWDHLALKYAFSNWCSNLTVAETEAAVAQALALWSGVTDLTFTPVLAGAAHELEAHFSAGTDGNGTPFDGAIAHCYYPPPGGGSWAGDAHFNEEYVFEVDLPIGSGSMDLVNVAGHEFGHGIGLDHSGVEAALMWPYIDYGASQRALDDDDIAGIQSIYPPGVTPPPPPPPGDGPPEVGGWIGTPRFSNSASGGSWDPTPVMTNSRQSDGTWVATVAGSYRPSPPAP